MEWNRHSTRLVTFTFLLLLSVCQGARSTLFYRDDFLSECIRHGPCEAVSDLSDSSKRLVGKSEENGRQIISTREDMNTRINQLEDQLKQVYDRLGLTTHKCGVRNSAVDRMVGGVHDADINEYPWQVALTTSSDGKPFCGGSIISNQWILTAAHCLERCGSTASINANQPGSSRKDPSSLKVVIGEHDWSVTTETPWTERRQVAEIIFPPDYMPDNIDKDLALLKLLQPIDFPVDNTIAPVCLPSTDDLYEHVDAIVTGWSTDNSDGMQPHVLQATTVPTMSNEECQRSYSNGVNDNIICAEFVGGGKDACQGDAGGDPLITSRDDQSMELIGVVSWGSGCSNHDAPGLYVRVSNYLPWINSHIRL